MTRIGLLQVNASIKQCLITRSLTLSDYTDCHMLLVSPRQANIPFNFGDSLISRGFRLHVREEIWCFGRDDLTSGSQPPQEKVRIVPLILCSDAVTPVSQDPPPKTANAPTLFPTGPALWIFKTMHTVPDWNCWNCFLTKATARLLSAGAGHPGSRLPSAYRTAFSQSLSLFLNWAKTQSQQVHNF